MRKYVAHRYTSRPDAYRWILLNRSGLLVEEKEMQDVLERYARGKPWHHLIANVTTTCVEAARESIKLIVALVDSGQPSYLTSMVSPVGAVYVLAIHVLRERNSLLIRSDFEVGAAPSYSISPTNCL
jgi:hypothetical protein